MSNKVENSKCIFKFSKNNSAALTVPSGSVVIINTKDCFSNQLQNPNDTIEVFDWNKLTLCVAKASRFLGT